jgi:hypothetical protein
MAKAKVDMHLDHVMLRVEGATDEVLHAVALQVEGTTKRNIVSNDQIDTAFMLNSVYTESQEGSTFGKTWDGPPGKKAPKVRLPRLFSAAAVHVSAVYAIYQEMMDPFLRPAAQEVAGQVNGIADSVYRRALHD